MAGEGEGLPIREVRQSWRKQGCDVFVYFDNDQKSAAPADALKLRYLLQPISARA